MHRSELQREDYASTVFPSLERHFSRVLGRQTEIDVNAVRGDWRFFPLAGAFVHKRCCTDVRYFLRDLIRFTPRLRRLPVQALAGTAATTKLGLRFAGSKAFSVSPPPQHPESIVILIGNQRLRVLDFRAGVTTVASKHGYGNECITRELTGRQKSGLGPRVLDANVDEGWFTEPIFDGYALPRVPPWFRRVAIDRMVLQQLRQVTETTSETVNTRAFLEPRIQNIRARLEELSARFATDTTGAFRLLDAGFRVLDEQQSTETCFAHRDLQPGNILISRDGNDIAIIDWERSGRASACYDRLTFTARTRAGAGIAKRLRDVLETGTHKTGRHEVAHAMIEDLLFFAEENSSQSLKRPTQGLQTYLSEAADLVAVLRK